MPQPRRTISALQDNFFREFVGLSDVQIEDIRAEKAIAKVLESPTPDEVIVFGAVYLHSAPERSLIAEERRDVMLGSEGRSQFVSSW
jgi:hypothetical protein